jgi:thiol-disulfide isomerase/thioredoxin
MKYTCMLLVAVCGHISLNYAQVNTPIQNTVVISENKQPMLLGHCTISKLKEEPFDSWFVPNYTNYKPDSSLLTDVAKAIRKKHIDIFMGTWCGDSKREVPAMLKILNEIGFDSVDISLITVGNNAELYKKSPQGEELGKNIVRVPTFIIYDKKKEIGRIIEYPVESLERDLLKILRKEPYIPNYHQLRL